MNKGNKTKSNSQSQATGMEVIRGDEVKRVKYMVTNVSYLYGGKYTIEYTGI